MKKIILIIFLFNIFTYAQEGNQSVELPDFVITGNEQVKLPILKKKRPKLITTLSQEFFLPTPDAGSISIVNFDNPLKKQIQLKKSEHTYDGKLIVTSGMYTLPYGKFIFDKNIKHVLLHLNIYGSNETDYKPLAGYNVSGGEAAVSFFVSKNSKFLPGLKIRTFVDGYRDSYHLFATERKSKRETKGGNAGINLEYKLNKSANFGINGSGNLLSDKTSGLTSNKYTLNAESQLSLQNVGISVKGTFIRLSTKSNLIKSYNKNYLNATATIDVKSMRSFNAKFGTVVSYFGSDLFLSPIASFQLEVDKNIFMFAEYNPFTQFISSNDHLKKNRYIDFNTGQYNYIKHTSFFKLAFKYEHFKMFEIGAGILLESISGLPYYQDKSFSGKYEIFEISKAKRNGAFLSVMFHPNYWGQFYSELTFSNTRNEESNVVPYYPLVSVNSVYTYDFKFGLQSEILFDYYSQIYSDISNSNKLPDYINLSLNLKYKLSSKVKLLLSGNNLLNRDNFLLNGYLLKPFEVVGGIEYRW